jgi:hypothetical protein
MIDRVRTNADPKGSVVGRRLKKILAAELREEERMEAALERHRKQMAKHQKAREETIAEEVGLVKKEEKKEKIGELILRQRRIKGYPRERNIKAPRPLSVGSPALVWKKDESHTPEEKGFFQTQVILEPNTAALGPDYRLSIRRSRFPTAKDRTLGRMGFHGIRIFGSGNWRTDGARQAVIDTESKCFYLVNWSKDRLTMHLDFVRMPLEEVCGCCFFFFFFFFSCSF